MQRKRDVAEIGLSPECTKWYINYPYFQGRHFQTSVHGLYSFKSILSIIHQKDRLREILYQKSNMLIKVYVLALIVSLIQSRQYETRVNTPGTSPGEVALVNDAIPACLQTPLASRQTRGLPLSPCQHIQTTVTSSSSSSSQAIGVDTGTRRSSVNFGGKIFLPENICMKN